MSTYLPLKAEDDEKDFAEGLLSGEVLLRHRFISSKFYKIYFWALHLIALSSVTVATISVLQRQSDSSSKLCGSRLLGSEPCNDDASLCSKVLYD